MVLRFRSLDQATIETLTEMFNRLDRDGDGFVSIDEHKAMWNSLDTDGNAKTKICSSVSAGCILILLLQL